MANVPDVRVRLSAEGTQEVIDAFRKVQRESDAAKKSFLDLKGAGKQLAAALPSLSVAALGYEFFSAAKNAVAFGDGLSKLHQKTGLSANSLGLMAIAAQQADLDFDALSQGLVKFQQTMGNYAQGATKARAAVQQLFGDPNALKGIPDDQKLQKVVSALAKLGPSANQTALAMQFFGKAGANLLPMINSLGEDGLAKLQKRLQDMGLDLNAFTASAAKTDAALKDMELTGRVAAMSFMAGFGPAITSGLASVNQAISGAGGLGIGAYMKQLGTSTADLLNSVLFAFTAIGKATGALVALIVEDFSFAWEEVKLGAASVWESFRHAATGDFAGAWAALKSGARGVTVAMKEEAGRQAAIFKQTADEIKADYAAIVVAPGLEGPTAPKPKPIEGPTPLDLTAIRDRLALIESEAQNELKIIQARGQAQDQLAKEEYASGLISLSQYYADRRAIQERETQAQAQVLLAQMDQLNAMPLAAGESETQRRQKIEAVRTAWALLYLKTQADEAALNAQQVKDANQLAATIRAMDAEVAQSRGDLDAQEAERNRQKVAAYRLALNQEDLADAERQARVQQYSNALDANLKFAAQQRTAEAQLNDLANQRALIEDKVATGSLNEYDALQQIAALEQQRLPVVRAIAEAMLAQAQASGNQQQIEQARQLLASIRMYEQEQARATDATKRFGLAVRQQFGQDVQQNLFDFFNAGEQGAASFGDAMRNLALSFVQSLRKMVAEALAANLTRRLFGATGGLWGLIPGFGSAGGGAAPAPAAHAGGGLIRGSGSSVSDSILARLSDYEYVIRSSVVRQPGMLALLEQINAGFTPRHRGLPGFADGGLVTVSAPGGGAGKADLTVGLDEGLLLKKLEASREFGRVMVRVAESNAKSMNTALGR